MSTTSNRSAGHEQPPHVVKGAGSLRNLRMKVKQSAPAPEIASVVGEGQSTPAKSLKRSSCASSVGSCSAPKRRGGVSPSAAASTVGGGGGGSDPSSPGSGDGIADAGKQCIACARITAFDPSFLTGSQPFPWLYPDSKGTVCRDCGNLYRCGYRSRMTQVIFERWLTSPANRLVWRQHLLAYLSLKFDGIQHVTWPSVENRTRMLSWLMDIMQLPFPGAESVPITPDFLQKVASQQAGHYIVASQDGQSAMGLQPVFVPAPSAIGRRFVSKAQASRAWPLLPLRALPGGSAGLWYECMADQSFETQTPALTDQAGDPEEPPAARRLETLTHNNKVEALESAVRLLVQCFIGDNDKQTKEKEFTPLLARALRVKQDLLDAMADAELINRMTVLSSIVNSCKKVVRPLRDFAKHGKRSTIEGIYDCLAMINEYSNQKGIAIGSDFGKAWVKSHFFKLHVESPVKALEFLSSYEFPWKVDMLQPSSLSHPSKVVHQCLLAVILEQLQREVSIEESEWEAQKVKLLANCKAYLECTALLATKWPSLNETHSTLREFEIILRAACRDPELSPADVVKAKAHVDASIEATQLKEGLKFRGVGLAVSTDSDALIVSGSLDQTLDQDYSLNFSALFEDGMPDNGDAGELVSVARTLLEIDGDSTPLLRIMAGSLEGLTAVIKGWSTRRLADTLDEFKGVMQHCALIVQVFDLKRSLDAMNMWAASRKAWADIDLLVGDAQALSRNMEELKRATMPPESLVISCEKVATVFMDTLVSAAPFDPSLKEERSSVLQHFAQCRRNAACRAALWTESSHLLAIWESKVQSPEASLQQLMGDQSSGVLHSVLSIAELRRGALDSLTLDASGWPLLQMQPAIDEDSASPTEVRAFIVEFFAEFATNSPAAMAIDRILSPIFSLAGNTFCADLILSSVNLTMPVENWTSGKGHEPLETFSRGRFPKAVSAVGDVINADSLAALDDDEDATLDALQEALQPNKLCTMTKRILSVKAANDNDIVCIPSLVRAGSEGCPKATLDDIMSIVSEVESVILLSSWVQSNIVAIGSACGEGLPIEKFSILMPTAVIQRLSMILTVGVPNMLVTTMRKPGAGQTNFVLHDIATFVNHWRSTWIPRQAQLLEATLLQYISVRSDNLLKSLPRYDHIVTNRFYNPQLAKRQLLMCPQRPHLANMVSDVGLVSDAIIDSIGKLRAVYPSDNKPDLDSSDEICATRSALDIAAKTMTVLAGVNALEDFGGTPQDREMAVSILRRSAGLPQALKERLEALSMG